MLAVALKMLRLPGCSLDLYNGDALLVRVLTAVATKERDDLRRRARIRVTKGASLMGIHG